MAATTPIEKSPQMIEWMAQAAPFGDTSTVEKMNDQLPKTKLVQKKAYGCLLEAKSSL